MPVDLSVKKVPDEVAQKLRERAGKNHRSLQRELLVILQRAVENDAAAKYETKQGRVIPAPSESALIIRRFRDGRNFTARDLYEHVTSLGGPAPDEAEELIRRSRDRR